MVVSPVSGAIIEDAFDGFYLVLTCRVPIPPSGILAAEKVNLSLDHIVFSLSSYRYRRRVLLSTIEPISLPFLLEEVKDECLRSLGASRVSAFAAPLRPSPLFFSFLFDVRHSCEWYFCFLRSFREYLIPPFAPKEHVIYLKGFFDLGRDDDSPPFPRVMAFSISLTPPRLLPLLLCWSLFFLVVSSSFFHHDFKCVPFVCRKRF